MQSVGLGELGLQFLVVSFRKVYGADKVYRPSTWFLGLLGFRVMVILGSQDSALPAWALRVLQSERRFRITWSCQ